MSQPWATVIAALIAVVAAGLALTGVLLTLRANERQHKERLDAERVARDNDERVAAAVRRRDEAVRELVSASESAMRAFNLVGSAHAELLGVDNPGPWTSEALAASFEDCEMAEMRLDVMGLEPARESFRSYLDTMRSIWGEVEAYAGPYPDFGPAFDALDAMREAFRQTVTEIGPASPTEQVA